MPWLLLIIKHILPISELYSSFRRTDLTTGDILVATVTFWWPVSLRNTPLSKEITDYTPGYTVMLSWEFFIPYLEL